MSDFKETQTKTPSTPGIQMTSRRGVGLVGFLVAAAFLPVGASPRVLDSADVLDSTQRGYFSQGAEPAEVFDNALGLTPGQAIVYPQGHFEIREGVQTHHVPAERLSENLRKRDHQGLAAFIQQGGRLQVLTYTDGTYGLREFLGLKGGVGGKAATAAAISQEKKKEFQKKYNDPNHSFEKSYGQKAETIRSVAAWGAGKIAQVEAGGLTGLSLPAAAAKIAAREETRAAMQSFVDSQKERGAQLDRERAEKFQDRGGEW